MHLRNSKSIDYYDDSGHNYEDFWVGRDYEHLSELIAIRNLLKGKYFHDAIDFGGGYGRLTPHIVEFCDHVTIIDPSQKQLRIARSRLAKYDSISFERMERADEIPAGSGTVDLLVMIRVSHHLHDPGVIFSEIQRALRPGGYAIIEIANQSHMLNRLKYLGKLRPVPTQPIEVGNAANGIRDDTPFLNHHPAVIERLFEANGLTKVRKLSVSNLRSRFVKQHIKLPRMIAWEAAMQPKLAGMSFGPSIFYLVRKN